MRSRWSKCHFWIMRRPTQLYFHNFVRPFKPLAKTPLDPCGLLAGIGFDARSAPGTRLPNRVLIFPGLVLWPAGGRVSGAAPFFSVRRPRNKSGGNSGSGRKKRPAQ